MTGFEPAASCSQSRRATNCATPGYSVYLSGWSYSPKSRALPTALHPDIHFSAMIPRRTVKIKFFLSVVIPVVKAAFVPFSATGKNLLSPVSQGFAAFRLAPSRIPPRHSQSRRATSCATPGYVLFSAAACVCTHFKRKRCFLPHPFSAIALSSRVRFQTAQAANLNISQFA